MADFGTATNLDVVDSDGAHSRGGAISPGIMISANALFARAAASSSIPIKAPETALGNTTRKRCSGRYRLAPPPCAEGLVARTLKEPGIEGATVIATVAWANNRWAKQRRFDGWDPQLTFARGIYLI